MGKTGSKLKVLPNKPPTPRKPVTPKVPPLFSPLGTGGDSAGAQNAPVVPRNSQKGVKQRMDLDVPGTKLQ